MWKRSKKVVIVVKPIKAALIDVFFTVEAFRGCPEDRCNMEFFLTFHDAAPHWIRWCDDFGENSVFQKFCERKPQLRQLLLSQSDAKNLRKTTLLSPISLVKPGMTVYVDLRSWSPLWYNKLTLPCKDKLTYVTRCVYGAYVGKDKVKIISSYPDMSNEVFVVDNWFVTIYGHHRYYSHGYILLSPKMIKAHKLGPKRLYNKKF